MWRSQNKFKKILIANRGEIARRVIQAAHEMGYGTVIPYAPADREALPTQMATEAYALKGEEVRETYLDIEQILQIAKVSQCDAVHPGYGFLSENFQFAQQCEQEGICFIGPSPQSMKKLGDKLAAKQLAQSAQVPVVPGWEQELPKQSERSALCKKIGFPLLIKAAAGGGGKGMRVVKSFEELEPAIEAARREAEAYFGNATVFLEKYIEEPRHIEVQILGDLSGNVVHLYERECSLQRRHQKMVEEAPSPSIPSEVRQALCEAAVRLAKKAGYYSAGTVEFMADQQNQFYFLEVNTRLQVEHPVTEWVTGIDLVKAQIKIAEGNHLPWQQSEIQTRGHAIECRLYAEDPENQFLPTEGCVGVLREPQRPGVRIDSALIEGQKVHSIFDPMLGKLITFGIDREEARNKMAALLRDYVLLGIPHNLDFLRYAIESQVFEKGYYHTHSAAVLLEGFLKTRQDLPQQNPEAFLLALMASRKKGARAIRSKDEPHRLEEELHQQLAGFRNV